MLYSKKVENKKCCQCKDEASYQIIGVEIKGEEYACDDCYESYWKYNNIIIED